MQFIPLTNKMGYEFALVNSLLQFIFWGILLDTGENSRFTLNNKLIIFAIIFLFPIFLSLVSEIISGFCSFVIGLKFYFLFIFPANFLGFCLYEFLNDIRIRYKKVIFFVITSLILFEIIIELFFFPQVYFYNLLISYFPGTIYDELIRMDWKLILSRLLPIILGIMFLGLTKFFKQKNIKLIAVFSIIIFQFFLKSYLGLSTTIGRLENELPNIEKTENFVIYFDRSIDYKMRERITLLHEYYFYRIYNELGIKPQKIIKSFIYKNEEQKGKLFGSRVADITKPWLYQIHINLNSIDNNLLHEIIHIFSAEIGVTPLKLANKFNPAIIEGFAMAVEEIIEPTGELDELALLGIKYLNISPNNIFDGINFFSFNSNVGYLLSGSFIKFLYNNYGKNKVFNYYKNSDIYVSFYKKPDELYKDYFEYINQLHYSYNQNKAIYYFGYPPLINKKCARYIAYKLDEINNIFVKGRYRKAAYEYNKLYRESNNLSAFNGYIICLIKLKKYDVAFSELSKILIKSKNSNIYYRLKFTFEKLKILMNHNDLSGLDELEKYNLNSRSNLEIYKLNHLAKYDINLAKKYLEEDFDITKIENDSLKLLFSDIRTYNIINWLGLTKEKHLLNNVNYRVKFEQLADEYFLNNEYENSKKIINELIKLNIDINKQCLYFSKLQKINWFIDKSKKKELN